MWRHAIGIYITGPQDSKKNPKKTASDILKSRKSSRPTSVNTVKRIPKNYKLFGRVAATMPILSDWHIHNRIQLCKSYGQLHPSLWKDVIFSDEWSVEIYSRKRENMPADHHGVVWWEIYHKTVKYGGKNLMVWGAIKEDSIRILIRCPDRINSVVYENVFKRGLLLLGSQDGEYLVRYINNSFKEKYVWQWIWKNLLNIKLLDEPNWVNIFASWWFWRVCECNNTKSKLKDVLLFNTFIKL